LRARSSLECPTGEVVELPGHLPLPLVGRVLIDHRRPRAGVAHALHQLSDRRSGVRGEVVTGVPQVVKVDLQEARVCECPIPDAAVEVGVPKGAVIRPREDQPLVAGLRMETVTRQMPPVYSIVDRSRTYALSPIV
jgi:hypothetical protein